MPQSANSVSYTQAMIGVILVCYAGLLVWPDFMVAMGAGHAGVWFLDINTLLASNDAVVQGLNPYLPNPLDYTRDPHVYSDWWLQLRHVGLGRKDRLWLGAVIDGLFFLALFWRLRARSFRELLVVWLLVWSPPFILGFNRANPDLLVYALLVPTVPMLLSRCWWMQAIGYALITLAIGLKYYPAVACGLILLTARSRRELGKLTAVWLGLALLLGLNLYDDVARSPGLMTATAGFYTFGSAALAANLGHEALVWAGGWLLALGAFAQGWRRPVFKMVGANETDRAGYFLGAVLLVVCFALTVSYTYRLVFSLMAVPWLLGLTRSQWRVERVYGWAMLLVSVCLLWSDGMATIQVNMNLDQIPKTQLRPLVNALVAAIHVLGWIWVWLWLLGLGTMTRFIWERWTAPAVVPSLDPRLAPGKTPVS